MCGPVCFVPSVSGAADLFEVISDGTHTWARVATCMLYQAIVALWFLPLAFYSTIPKQHIFTHPLPTLLTLQIAAIYLFDMF